MSALNYVVQVAAREQDEPTAIRTYCRRVIGGAEHSDQGYRLLAVGNDMNHAAANGLDLQV